MEAQDEKWHDIVTFFCSDPELEQPVMACIRVKRATLELGPYSAFAAHSLPPFSHL